MSSSRRHDQTELLKDQKFQIISASVSAGEWLAVSRSFEGLVSVG